jgi:hypothetical protein
MNNPIMQIGGAYVNSNYGAYEQYFNGNTVGKTRVSTLDDKALFDLATKPNDPDTAFGQMFGSSITDPSTRKHYEDMLRKNEPEKYFANGGAFTNGIVDRPTSFNMGLMGEVGSEAIMPLTNVNGKLGVHVIQPAANDSGNNEEELAELKTQNRLLQAQIEVMQAAFQTLIKQNEVTNDKLDSIDSTTRKQVNG